jgi:hypothetical protein
MRARCVERKRRHVFDELAPMLKAPGAADVLRAVAPRDRLGALAALADALEPDPLDRMRPNGDDTVVELIARYAACAIEEFERLR